MPRRQMCVITLQVRHSERGSALSDCLVYNFIAEKESEKKAAEKRLLDKKAAAM